MGWAKYMEDDLEMIQYRSDSYRDTSITVIFPYPILSEGCFTADFKLESSRKNTVPEYQERYLKCVKCGSPFLFSADAQRQYAAKNWTAPKRCRNCRKSRIKNRPMPV